MKQRVRFIINPVSGGKNKTRIPALIEKACIKTHLDVDICFSTSVSETREKTQEAIAEKINSVIAVGGDGTINIIGSQLIHSNTSLGIIPMGSGNGLARSLGIPFDIEKAVRIIESGKLILMDTGSLNGVPFMNLAGVGFDAHVAGMFHHSVNRGLLNYAKITLKEFNQFRPEHLVIEINGETFEQDAFLMTVCNGPQFGNNAFIAPKAMLSDGLFHITLLKQCSWKDAPGLAIKLFRGTIDNHVNTVSFVSNSVKIIREKSGLVNIDGEPVNQSNELQFSMIPSSLKVIIP